MFYIRDDRKMEYFWLQQDDVPAGMGYPLFGFAHLTGIFVTLALATIFGICFFKAGEKKQKLVLKAIPVILIGLEIFKDLFLVSVHRFGTAYLPLHVCSMGMFVFFFREFLPWKKAKDYLGEVAYILIMPGGLAGLIFADWTEYYPMWNFINLHSYVWHGLLVLYPILIRKRGDIKLQVKHIYRVISFLLVVVPPIYAFDKAYGRNYFFVNWPVEGSPLAFFAEHMGNPGYLVGYAALTVAVFLMIYLMDWTWDGPRGRG